MKPSPAERPAPHFEHRFGRRTAGPDDAALAALRAGPLWKVCGITSAADAAAAIDAGADALGFIFWPRSRRAVAPAAAAEIAAGLSDDVLRVGVFVDARRDEVERAVEQVGLDRIQLHGDETPDACRGFRPPVWKALRLADGATAEDAEAAAAPYAGTILLDAGGAGRYGGTGETVDWDVAAHLARRRRVVLAGGLRPENVAAAIQRVRPWGIDVASGVESAPGRKDPAKLRAFAAALGRRS